VKPGESIRIVLTGFQPNERIAFWINLPDGSIFGAPDQIAIEHNGTISYRTNPIPIELDAGVYSFVFQGIESKHASVVYFRIVKP
jgi:hypothetical protein